MILNKKYNCLIAIGCSHMFGSEHKSTNNNKQPSTETWANHLGNYLNLPVYNFSIPGASNQTILRRLYISLDFVASHKLNPLFVLQWATTDRFELFSQSAYNVCQDWPWLSTLGEVLKKSGNQTLQEIAKHFYKAFDSLSCFYETLKSVEHANLILSNKNFLAINCLGSGWPTETLKHPMTEFVRHFDTPSGIYERTLESILKNLGANKDIDMEKYNVVGYKSHEINPLYSNAVFSLLWKNILKYPWWLYHDDTFQTGLRKFVIDNNWPLGPDNHPLEHANKMAFEYMISQTAFLDLLERKN